jgi:hypothetical protein
MKVGLHAVATLTANAWRNFPVNLHEEQPGSAGSKIVRYQARKDVMEITLGHGFTTKPDVASEAGLRQEGHSAQYAHQPELRGSTRLRQTAM